MRRRLIPSLIVLASFLGLCSSASAAAGLQFAEIGHSPTTINRGDELGIYTVKLKNVGDAATAGTTNVSIDLPVGVELAAGSGSGWSCHLTARTCSSSQAVAPGGEFPSLSLRTWIYPDEAPDTITTGFTGFGGGAPADAFEQHSFTLGPAVPFGISSLNARTEDPLGADYTIAGGHPFVASSSLEITTHTTPVGELAPNGSLRDLYFELPAGFIGNPEAADLCTFVQVSSSICAATAAVGGIRVAFSGEPFSFSVPLYRIVPEQGFPAAFAFRPISTSSLTVVLRAKLRSNGDYGITAISPLPPQDPRFLELEFAQLCGFGPLLSTPVPGEQPSFLGCLQSSDPDAREVPFLSNPTRCGGEVPVTVARLDSYQSPGAQTTEGFPSLGDPNWKSKAVPAPATTDCGPLTEAWVGEGPEPTEPTLEFQPENTRAATPTGYTAHLHVPQDGLLEKDGRATAHLKDTIVTLPEGIVLNPSAANGLGSCSEAQAGLVGTNFGSPSPIRFSTTSDGCPEDSKIGTAEVSTPILDQPLPGAVYLAAQDENPFGSRFAIYLVIDDKETGVKATLAGKVVPDEQTGRIATTFANNPQTPIEDVVLRFFGGPRGSLANPDVCAAYTTRSELTPWSAVDPDNPLASEIATSEDTVNIDAPVEGQANCPTSKAARPFDVGFSAKSTNAAAGSSTPFVLRLTRGDGNQEFDQVSVVTPPGFVAALKGVDSCSEAALAAAGDPSRTGVAELNSPSCPGSSRIGATTIGAGVGPSPYFVETGRVYLTGPYKGAPLGLAFVVPAVAGPFDLGVQVVRTALHVDPKTAQVTAKSDPIPQILDGVPLQVRDIRVMLDRPGFALNPTNCEPMSVSGRVSGGSGAVANVTNHFQVDGCDKLGFEPRLKLRLQGATKRDKYQKLTATLTARPGDANIARASVRFPQSIFLAQEHIRTICTRVQFAADSCPPGSVYGYAEAVTPLLDEPVVGPVYLRSSDNVLPDLVAALRGPDRQPIEIELAGRTDSKNKGIRNTFDVVPDAPVSSFTLRMMGGKKSLLVTSRNICKRKERAVVEMSAQNGLQRDLRPVIQTDCRKKNQKRAKKGRPGKNRAERQAWYLGT